MLFFGNLLKESGVTKRLATTASTSMIDIVTILLGLTVGASTQADVFLTPQSIMIFVLGAISFIIATAGGLFFAKVMNLFLRGDKKINPLIGASGVSAVPDSARVVQHEGLKADPSNHLLMHAMAPNVSGVIGSAVAAGIMLSFFILEYYKYFKKRVSQKHHVGYPFYPGLNPKVLRSCPLSGSLSSAMSSLVIFAICSGVRSSGFIPAIRR